MMHPLTEDLLDIVRVAIERAKPHESPYGVNMQDVVTLLTCPIDQAYAKHVKTIAMVCVFSKETRIVGEFERNTIAGYMEQVGQVPTEPKDFQILFDKHWFSFVPGIGNRLGYIKSRFSIVVNQPKAQEKVWVTKEAAVMSTRDPEIISFCLPKGARNVKCTFEILETPTIHEVVKPNTIVELKGGTRGFPQVEIQEGQQWGKVELPVDGWTWEQARHMLSDININIPKHGRGLKLVYEIPLNPPEPAQPAFLRKVQD